MSAQDYVGIATCITATGAAVVSIIVAIRQQEIRQNVSLVREETRTGNGHTLGQIAERVAHQVIPNE